MLTVYPQVNNLLTHKLCSRDSRDRPHNPNLNSTVKTIIKLTISIYTVQTISMSSQSQCRSLHSYYSCYPVSVSRAKRAPELSIQFMTGHLIILDTWATLTTCLNMRNIFQTANTSCGQSSTWEGLFLYRAL